ncbi:MAG: type II secretion system protein GspD, partial [Nitrospina sp.]|nr:type II secretion system protein GspD [Nitrospina sp.]
MKKIFLLILIISVYLSSGCIGNRKSAFEKFKEKNPIDKMVFSEKNTSEKLKVTQENFGKNKNGEDLIDLSALKSIPDHPISRLIKVSGEKV